MLIVSSMRQNIQKIEGSAYLVNFAGLGVAILRRLAGGPVGTGGDIRVVRLLRHDSGYSKEVKGSMFQS